MPNWCVNKLYVAGRKSKVNDFLTKVATEDSAFDFDGILPYPEEWKLMDRAQRAWEEDNAHIPWPERPPRPGDGYNNGGYEWCCRNWGTKWNACDVQVVPTTRGCTIYFTTAWSPPGPVVAKASELFPELLFTLKYWEGGAGFKGVFTAQAGETHDDESTYTGSRGG